MKKTYIYSWIILIVLLIIIIIYYLNTPKIINNDSTIEVITESWTSIKESDNLLEVKGVENIWELEKKNEVKRN